MARGEDFPARTAWCVRFARAAGHFVHRAREAVRRPHAFAIGRRIRVLRGAGARRADDRDQRRALPRDDCRHLPRVRHSQAPARHAASPRDHSDRARAREADVHGGDPRPDGPRGETLRAGGPPHPAPFVHGGADRGHLRDPVDGLRDRERRADGALRAADRDVRAVPDARDSRGCSFRWPRCRPPRAGSRA